MLKCAEDKWLVCLPLRGFWFYFRVNPHLLSILYDGAFLFPHRCCLAKCPPRMPGRNSNPGPALRHAARLH
jgi:hypothetical protein